MKKIHFLLLIFTIAFAAVSCNDEWDEELYKHYVSFKAPLNAKGVTDIYVKYKKGEASNYQLPLIVSGTTTNPNELNVKIALDPDSLNVLNYERFQNRHELYFRQLESTFYNMPQQSVTIPAGSRQALLPINFKFEGIDMFYKWILPLTIVEEESNNYRPHPRKNYRKAMLRVIPFNDYSGVYQSTAMRIYFKGTTTNALVVSTRTASVVEDNSIFFYAGATDEEYIERHRYKITASFNEDGTLDLHAEDKSINFQLLSTPKYTIEETMDDLLPYLKHKYITIELSYSYDDVTSVPGTPISYEAKGTMIMERKINTQIPDEDQAIQW